MSLFRNKVNHWFLVFLLVFTQFTPGIVDEEEGVYVACHGKGLERVFDRFVKVASEFPLWVSRVG